MAVKPYPEVLEEMAVQIPAGLDAKILIDLYRAMVLMRAYDEKGVNMARQGKTTIYYPATGEEAAIVGSVFALEPQDWVYPYYRQAGAYLMRGMPLEKMFGHLLGNSADICRGHQNPGHYSYALGNAVSNSSPVGTQIIQAVGTAMAAKIKRSEPKSVIAVFFGDGATSTADFHSGLNFAGVFQAPVLFLCVNNHWAISTPVSHQTAVKDLADKAQAYGISGHVVDGNDVLAVYQASRDALDRARQGGGPQFLELKTYRMGGHSSADNPDLYRSEEEVKPWREKDPLQRLQKFLKEVGLWDDDQEEALWHMIQQEINEKLAQTEALSSLSWETIFDHLYATLPARLAAQKESVRQWMSLPEL